MVVFLPKFMFYLIAAFPGLCAQRGVPRDHLDKMLRYDGTNDMRAEDALFKRISLFGEDRKKKLSEAFPQSVIGVSRWYTIKERRFMMLCARTPSKRKAPFSRRRMKVSTFDFV